MLILAHIIPPDVEFPPMKYGGAEKIAYYLIKAQIGFF
jgi:hypothetical protein